VGRIQQPKNRSRREYYRASTPPSRDKKMHQSTTTVQFCIILQKTPTTQAQGIGTLNQKQPWMNKSQCRNINQQDNSSLSKTNTVTKDLKTMKRKKYQISKNNSKND
jgi:hypothetical protein